MDTGIIILIIGASSGILFIVLAIMMYRKSKRVEKIKVQSRRVSDAKRFANTFTRTAKTKKNDFFNYSYSEEVSSPDELNNIDLLDVAKSVINDNLEDYEVVAASYLYNKESYNNYLRKMDGVAKAKSEYTKKSHIKEEEIIIDTFKVKNPIDEISLSLTYSYKKDKRNITLTNEELIEIIPTKNKKHK